MQTQYVVLYCGTDDITGRSQENILKELVTDTYGADSYSLVHSDKIIDRERRRISSKYFSPRTQAKILMDRQKSQKERGI